MHLSLSALRRPGKVSGLLMANFPFRRTPSISPLPACAGSTLFSFRRVADMAEAYRHVLGPSFFLFRSSNVLSPGVVEKGLKVGQDITLVSVVKTSASDLPGHPRPQQLSVSRTGGVRAGEGQLCMSPSTKVVVDIWHSGKKGGHQAFRRNMPRQSPNVGMSSFISKRKGAQPPAGPPWAVARGCSSRRLPHLWFGHQSDRR